jgi:hypothetical protein
MRNGKIYLSVAAGILYCCGDVLAQTAVPIWTNFYNGPSNGADSSVGVVADSSGNVFVTGQSDAGGGYDYVTIKYSSGGVPLWTNRYNGPGHGNDDPSAIAMDQRGNVFVTGDSYGGSSSFDYATIAYSSAGVPLWTNRYNGPSNNIDTATALALDSNGNIFVTGYSDDAGQQHPHYATVAYSNSGAPLWTNRYVGAVNGWDWANAIAVDSSGRVFVTGWSAPNSNNLSSAYATVAYSNAGVPLWTNRYQGPANGYDRPHAIAVDNDDNVLVTGGGASSSADYLTIKYSSDGLPLWTNRYRGLTSSGDIANAIAVDKGGTVFVTGRSDFGGSSPGYATVAYSSSGMPLWTNLYNGQPNRLDSAYAIALDGRGNVIVTGGSSAASFLDLTTLAYSNDGVTLWTNRFKGVANSLGAAVAVDGSGSVIVTGYTGVQGGSYNYVTIKYSLSVPLAIEKTGNEAVLSWANAAFGWTNANWRLQSAADLTGPFTNIDGATSPYTTPLVGNERYFRLHQE